MLTSDSSAIPVHGPIISDRQRLLDKIPRGPFGDPINQRMKTLALSLNTLTLSGVELLWYEKEIDASIKAHRTEQERRRDMFQRSNYLDTSS